MEFSNLQVKTASIPSIDDIQFEPLDIRYRTSQMLSSIIFFIATLLPIIFAYFYLNKVDIPFIWMVLVGLIWSLLFAVSLVYVYQSYNYEGYALREQDILYKSGIFFRSTLIVPFNRVQHAELQQGPIDRYFELGSLMLYTAGGSASDLVIKGLPYEKAQALKDIITKRIAHDEEE